MTIRLSPRSAVAKGALIAVLRPRMAMDSAVPDLTAIAHLMGKKGFDKAQVATAIRQSASGLLAKDADLEDLGEVLTALAPILDNEEEGADTSTEANSAFPMAGETEEDGWRRRAADARRRLGRDESEVEREDREEREGAEDARRRLGRDETPEECARREEGMDVRHARDRKMRRAEDAKKRLGRDEADDERRRREADDAAKDSRRAEDKRRARDSRRAEDGRAAEDRRRAQDMKRADDRRRASDRRRAEDKWMKRADDAKRRLGRDESEEEGWDREEREEAEDRRAEDARRGAEDNRRAMDEAISRERTNQRSIRDAERFVRPWVGELAADLAFDSATDVYRKALEMRGVKVEGMHPDAFRAVLEAQPRAGERQANGLAQDAALPRGVKSAAERFPDANRIQVLG